MDSITHFTLGAVVGEALLGKSLGKRAMAFGAVAQSLPDVDVVASLWLEPTENILVHRGFTHSFLFAALASICMMLIARYGFKIVQVPVRLWLLFFGIEIGIHLLLDSLNAYGVGWLEPFSPLRVSWNTFYVVDPFYTVPICIAFAALLILKRENRFRMHWVGVALTLSSFYMAYAIIHRWSITKDVQNTLANNATAYNRFLATPTPLNTWLWYIVVEDDSGYHVGYRSVYDKREAIDFHYFPRRGHLLERANDRIAVQRLLQFSQGYYTIEQWGDTLVFNDLRFGQISGWHNPEGKFVFHYYLQPSSENLLVMQRGRFAGWNRHTVQTMIRRIRGEDDD